MDYDAKKIFIRGKIAFIVTSVIYILLFLAGLFVQKFVFIEYARVIISVFLVIMSFFVNLLFGIPGYWITTAATVGQIFVYSSDYSQKKDNDILVLIAVALLSILVDTIFEFFILRVGARMDTLGRILSDEKAKRISYETDAMVAKTTSSRSGTIVRHEDIVDKPAYTEAVETSRTTTLDPLTTLPNRYTINEYTGVRILNYKKAFQDAADKGIICDIKPIYVVYLTISDPVRFSADNGHIIVDLFIQTMAHRLREATDSKDFVGRIANNEFAIVTTRFTEDADVISYTEKLSAELKKEHGGLFRAGIAQYPRDAMYAGELIQHAEEAMYQAVKNNAEAMVFEPSEAEKRSSFLEDMTIDEIKDLFDKAFGNNEIFMVYQPRFDAAKKLTGFEAFVRWECPGHGTVDTMNFLFYAEKTGHIFELGELSLRQSFETLALINEIDPSLTMTVNLSATQLQMPDLQIDLLSVAEESGCNLKNIIIDIPADGAGMNVSGIQNTLDAFASSGITMALDNFGRCYSSLNSIPLLPVSIIKLDGYFTRDLQEESSHDVLTRSIISLMKELDIPVDATNVSSAEQFTKLREYGCTYFQGTYLNEPLKRSQMIEYIKNYRN